MLTTDDRPQRGTEVTRQAVQDHYDDRAATYDASRMHRSVADEVTHILAGSHWTADSAHWVTCNQSFDPLDCEKQLFGDRGKTLAQRGYLGRDVMGASNHRQFFGVIGFRSKRCKKCHSTLADENECRKNLVDFDCLRKVAAEIGRAHV